MVSETWGRGEEIVGKCARGKDREIDRERECV